MRAQGDYEGALAALEEAIGYEPDHLTLNMAEYVRACYEAGQPQRMQLVAASLAATASARSVAGAIRLATALLRSGSVALGSPRMAAAERRGWVRARKGMVAHKELCVSTIAYSGVPDHECNQ